MRDDGGSISGSAATYVAVSGGALVLTTGTVGTTAADTAWDAGIDDEVQRLLRGEVSDATFNVAPVPPPAKMPKLSSAMLFALPGGVSGHTGLSIMRAKEVERRLNIARSERAKKARAEKTAEVEDSAWGTAVEALAILKAKGFALSALKKDHLLALVRVLKVGKAAGNKPQLTAMLVERFGNITAAQFAEIELGVSRGVAVTTLPATAPVPAPAPAQPTTLPLVEEVAPAAAPATVATSPAPLALTRPHLASPQ